MSNRDLDIHLHIHLPRWSVRRWLGLALVASTLAAAVVYANVNWTPFAGGEKLTSAKMNANFQAMADAITALQNAQPGTTPLPHLIYGGVDMGVWLGQANLYSDGGGYVFSGPVSYLPSVNSPYAFYQLNAYGLPPIYFDAANCGGNAYVPSGGYTYPVTNVAFNGGTTTIYQLTGMPPAKPLLVSYFTQGACMNLNAPTTMSAYPAKDTKVPNLAVTGTPIIKMM